jgi:hypothetical protein
MKRLLFLVMFLTFLLLVACGSETATPLPPTLELPTDVPATQTSAPVVEPTTETLVVEPTAVIVETAVIPEPTLAPPPTPIVVPTAPVVNRFHNLRFATNPSAAPQVIFPAGTGEVFAVWEYTAMNPGDLVQRSWRHNCANWLNRDEVWDTTVRGSSGTVTDVSIFETGVSGLPSGEYQLDLFVNGVWQAGGSFTIMSQPVQGRSDFSNLYFAAYPNGPAQTNFPADTTQVYAIWTYNNMNVNDVTRRQWALNGAVWLDRQDPWDYPLYGSNGKVTDVSIFGDGGRALQSGNYWMAVDLNGSRQLEGTFTIGQ